MADAARWISPPRIRPMQNSARRKGLLKTDGRIADLEPIRAVIRWLITQPGAKCVGGNDAPNPRRFSRSWTSVIRG
jgi:hypothetical protein